MSGRTTRILLILSAFVAGLVLCLGVILLVASVVALLKAPELWS